MNRVLWLLTCMAVTVASSTVQAEANVSQGVLIRLEGMVGPMMEAFLKRKLETARERGADLVIVEIDSPGGHLHTTFEIVDLLRDLPWARTVAYVPDEALSGAAIIALACDEIMIRPHARIGDVGLVIGGPNAPFRHAPEKLRSVLALRVRDLAEAKSRPASLVEAMVDMDLMVFEVTHRETGERAFMSEHELAADPDAEQWERGPLVFESREKNFLTVNGKRAVELGLANAVVDNLDDVRERFELETSFVALRPTAVDTAVYVLNSPLVTGLLFVIGLVALFIELSAPGISIGGLISGLCFALFFWSRVLGGTSTWLEIILFGAGVAFLAVELFVFPGFGVAGVMGLLLMVVSVVMASQDFVIPDTAREMATLGRSVMVVAISGFVFVIVAIGLTRWMGDIPVLSRLALKPPEVEPVSWSKEDKPSESAASDYQVAVGDWGVAESPLRPAGKARFADRYLDVVTEGAYVPAGSQVRLISITGNRLVVRAVEDESPPPPAVA